MQTFINKRSYKNVLKTQVQLLVEKRFWYIIKYVILKPDKNQS